MADQPFSFNGGSTTCLGQEDAPCRASGGGHLPSLSTEYEQLNQGEVYLGDFDELKKLHKFLEHRWFRKLSRDAKKQAERLAVTAFWFFKKHGLQNIACQAVTFEDDEKWQDAKEAQRAVNSLQTHYHRKEFRDYIRVFERQAKGTVHYHYLVATKEDIRTGFDFEAQRLLETPSALGGVSDERPSPKRGYPGSKRWHEVNARRNRSASPYLRRLWAEQRRITNGEGYKGIGRMDLLPVKSVAEAVILYVAKYLSKDFGMVVPQDKGVRRYTASKGAACRGPIVILSVGNDNYRDKLKLIVEKFGLTSDNYQQRFKQMLGPRWSHKIMKATEGMRLPVYRTAAHALFDRAIDSETADLLYLDGGPLKDLSDLQISEKESRESVEMAVSKIQEMRAKWNAFVPFAVTSAHWDNLKHPRIFASLEGLPEEYLPKNSKLRQRVERSHCLGCGEPLPALGWVCEPLYVSSPKYTVQ